MTEEQKQKQYVTKWKRKMLVYLYNYFDGDNAKIIDEFCSNKLFKEGKTDIKLVNKYFKDNNIKTTDYITFLDKEFKVEEMDPTKPIIVYKKGEKPTCNSSDNNVQSLIEEYDNIDINTDTEVNND